MTTMERRYRAERVLTSSRKSHQGLSSLMASRSSTISRYCSCTMALSGLPSPWYFAKMARASSARSWAISQRGDSGKKRIMTMTTAGSAHCRMVGMRQAHALSKLRLVPYVVHPARMLPIHQKLLYMPAMNPRYAGCASSTVYAGAAADAIDAPRPSTKRPPMNMLCVCDAPWMAVPTRTMTQPIKMHQRRP